MRLPEEPEDSGSGAVKLPLYVLNTIDDTSVCEELEEEIVGFRKIVTEKSRKVESKIASGRIANDGLSNDRKV